MKRSTVTVVLAALSLGGCAGPQAGTAPSEPLGLIAHYPLGGAGGWDLAAFDEASRRLFVSHSDRVMVMAADSGALIGEIAPTRGVHAIALAPSLNRGFTSDGATDSVSVFDLQTLQITHEIPVTGKNPDAILYDAPTRRVFAFNGHSDNATVIDAQTLSVLRTIALPGKPELAVSDEAGAIFVNIEDRSEILAIDAATATITHTWPLAPGTEPTGLAIDTVHRRLFATCTNHRMIVLDADSGRVVAALPIGDGPDSAAFDPATALAYSSNGEGTLTVVHEDDPEHFRVIANLPTRRSARTMALDRTKHRLYLPAAELGPTPAATPEHPHPRPSIMPGTFSVWVVGP